MVAAPAPFKRPGSAMLVGEALALLDGRYPAADAEDWDRVGLLEGDAASPVTHIVCALDPDVETLRRASECGADLLVTHHPTYLTPQPGEVPAYGLTLESVARGLGIALIACHTNLDVSEEARLSLGAALPLSSRGPLVTATDDQGQARAAFAQLWAPTEALTARQTAELLSRRYGCAARLTLAPASPEALTRVATATGAGGEALDAAIESGVELFITGELKYHQLIQARDCGLTCIELGHDVSEWPLAALLYDTLAGYCQNRGVVIELLERDLFSTVVEARD